MPWRCSHLDTSISLVVFCQFAWRVSRMHHRTDSKCSNKQKMRCLVWVFFIGASHECLRWLNGKINQRGKLSRVANLWVHLDVAVSAHTCPLLVQGQRSTVSKVNRPDLVADRSVDIDRTSRLPIHMGNKARI